MTLASRLTLIMNEKNISQAALGEMVEVSQTTIWKLMTGKTKSNRKLLQIAEALGVNIEWLSYGTGEKYNKNKQSEFNPSEKINVDDWDSNTPLGDDEVEVPYYSSIELAAGQGCSNCDDYNGHKLRFGKSFFRRKGAQKENVVCFPVRGDSMNPILPNGCTVAVDTGRKEIVDGDVYAICQGDLYRVKRLYRMPNNKIRINSFNSVDNPDEIDDQVNVQVIGRVFHYSAEL